MKDFHYLLGLMLILFLFTGCRADEVIIPSEEEVTGLASGKGGFYLLNEGNMGSNKSSLDFYNFATGIYSRNIYAERNPDQVMELGDVGNDIAVYGSKLYIAVNCSHKVEVLDAVTAEKITQIDIPNCRYLAFYEGNAYVSSYIGPIGADPDCPLGAVFRIDTLTLTISGQVATGYQPEEMTITDGTLFVANSGGYRAPDYDNTITAINLDSFTVDYTISTEINLHRIKKDRHGNIWVSSRGNSKDIPTSLICLKKDIEGRFAPFRKYDVSCDNFAFRGDSLLFIASSGGSNCYGIIDVTTGETKGSFIVPEIEKRILKPYAIAVDPSNSNILLTDAKNYVSSGEVFYLSGNGELLWSARTGDIPAAIAFTDTDTQLSSEPGASNNFTPGGAFIAKVFEYEPAPGQFVNLMPRYEAGDTYSDMLRKCELSICGEADEIISLGGFGGFITFGFDHMVENVEGEKDFLIRGNTVWQSDKIRGGSAEPGIVMVSQDTNGNGLPDDEWYELAGSEYTSPSTIHNYRIEYNFDGNTIRWTDSFGESDEMYQNNFHTQSYWPGWVDNTRLQFNGTRLAPNAIDESGNGTNYVLYSYPYGYADNYPNSFENENSFDISWAVDANGKPVRLPGIHFVKVMTGINQQCGPLGETSTEISGAKDLHYR